MLKHVRRSRLTRDMISSCFNTVEEAMREFDAVEGIPFRVVTDREATLAVFFSRCRKSDTGCWIWTGTLSNSGYGYFKSIAGRKGLGRGDIAHRLSHKLFIGPIPDGLDVLHSCDTPACVNPNHLRAGTRKENMADCIKRGRFKLPAPRPGTLNDLAKLTDADVVDIRNSAQSLKDLSKKYGIDRTNIHQIITGKTWTHVPMPEKRVEKADGRAKLTRNQVMAIKSADASIPHSQLSRQYGVGVPLISMIRNGRIWKSVIAAAQE